MTASHNPKVVSSNLTRATKLRLGFRLLAGLAVTMGVVACGDSVNNSISGPYASPQLSAPAAVASRSCDKVKAGQVPSGVVDARVGLIRQGTDLQRVSDTLTGAVPGGNFAIDSSIAYNDAVALASRLLTSNLCEPLKGQLVTKANTLRDVDASLKASGGASDSAAALQASQAAYKALDDALQALPNT